MRVAGWYALVASTWIVASDLLVTSAIRDWNGSLAVNIGKGLGFVLVTSLLLSIILHRLLQQHFDLEEQARQSTAALDRLKTQAEESQTTRQRVEAEAAAREQFYQELFRGVGNEVDAGAADRETLQKLGWEQLCLQRSALEAAANAIVITNREGIIRWVNPAFTELTGYSRQEAVGRKTSILKSGKHDAAFYGRLWDTLLRGEVWRGAITNKRKDGALYEEEMTLTPVRSAQGKIEHFIAIKQDITERKQLEAQFLRVQRIQSIGLLAGGVAHDLNNVLAPLMMALPLLRENLIPEQRDKILDTVEHSLRRGAGIVQQVLAFARGVDVQRSLIQVRHIIKDLTRITEETLPKDIRISISAPVDLWAIEADPTQIHQVLLNLVVNGRDAMPSGGQLSVTARNVELREKREFLNLSAKPGPYVSVSVSDTGAGITPDVLEHMFEPFFTTKPSGRGTGLGLSTVLGIVKSHNGLIEVRSRPGAGSIFTIYLPAPAKATVPEKPAAPAEVARGNGETILVVDDETSILRVLQSALEANNYRVFTAKDGAQAVARFGEHADKIKLVLTDIMMPNMDGLTLTRALKAAAPGLRVAAITGLLQPTGEPDRTEDLRALGVKVFLRKPFETGELLNQIAEALRN